MKTRALSVFAAGILLAMSIELRAEEHSTETKNWQAFALQDLAYIQQMLIENHPGFYNNEDTDFQHVLYNEYDQAVQKSQLVRTKQEYQTVIQTYAKKFDDIHLSVTFADKQQRSRKQNAKKASFTIQQLLPQVPWITLPHFEPHGEEIAALNHLVEQARSWRNDKAIIFDVRGNGGGNSVWAEKIVAALFSQDYFTEKRHAVTSNVSVHWRCSIDNINHIENLIPEFKQQYGESSQAYAWIHNLHQNMVAAQKNGLTYFVMTQESKPPCVQGSKNPVKAKIILIIDGACASACLDFIDCLKAMDHPLCLVGQTTQADSVYMELRTVALPSGTAQLQFPIKMYRNRMRGNKQPYVPDITYMHDLRDTQTLKDWIIKEVVIH